MGSHVSQFHARFDWKLALDAAEEATTSVDWSAASFIDEAIRECANRFYAAKAEGRRYFLDKTPRYYLLLEQLWGDYDDARFLLLRRHPASVVQSIHTTWKTHPCDSAMRYFVDDLLMAPALMHAFIQSHGSDERVLTMSYEDLVENPRGEVARACSWLGLEYSDAMLNYADNKSFRGSLGDPKIVERSLLKSRKFSREGRSICKSDDPRLIRFCRGLVDYYHRHGYTVPRSDLWYDGVRSWEFEKYVLSCGRAADAEVRRSSRLRFRIESVFRKILRRGSS